MPTQPSEQYSAFRTAHALLESKRQHVRDLEGALSEMKASLEQPKVKLSEAQAEDAKFVAAAIMNKSDRSKCAKCGSKLSANELLEGPPFCATCLEHSRRAVERVSLAEASISGTGLNLTAARSEAEAARLSEVAAFEAWVKEAYTTEADKLGGILGKALPVAARIDALAAVANSRAFTDHGPSGRGGFTGARGIPSKVQACIFSLGNPRSGETKEQRSAFARAVREALERVGEETFQKIPPNGRRPEPAPHLEAESAHLLGALHVINADGKKV